MLNKKKWIALVGFTLVLCGCGLMQQDAVLYSPANPPPVRVITPRFAHFEFGFMGRYRISHDYLIGPGIRECEYNGKYASSTMEEGWSVHHFERIGDFIEEAGDVLQYGESAKEEWKPFSQKLFVLGQPSTLPNLSGGVNKYMNFRPLCHDRVGGYEYGLYLQKSSAQSVQGSIEERKRVLETNFKGVGNGLPEENVTRGVNKWIVFKYWNHADYLCDAREHWHLPIGDGQYYYLVSFCYKSAVQKAAPADYAIYRAAFERILDSFKIEPLAVQ